MRINRYGKQIPAGIALISYLFLVILISTHSHALKWQENQLYEETENSVADNLLLMDGTCIFQFNGLFSYSNSDANNKLIIVTPQTGNVRITRPILKNNIFNRSIIWLRGPPQFHICSV